jgi:hypothetical protein
LVVPDKYWFPGSAISYKEWQTKYAGIVRAKAKGNVDNSAETFLFLNGPNLTEMASDPLMWVAIQLYAFEPTEFWADVSYLIESESETKETIFGEDEIPSRLSHAFGKITLLTEGITDSRILKASLNEFYPGARDLYSFVDFEEFKVEGGASPLAMIRGQVSARPGSMASPQLCTPKMMRTMRCTSSNRFASKS